MEPTENYAQTIEDIAVMYEEVNEVKYILILYLICRLGIEKLLGPMRTYWMRKKLELRSILPRRLKNHKRRRTFLPVLIRPST